MTTLCTFPVYLSYCSLYFVSQQHNFSASSYGSTVNSHLHSDHRSGGVGMPRTYPTQSKIPQVSTLIDIISSEIQFYLMSMGECNTILSAYTKYRHLG